MSIDTALDPRLKTAYSSNVRFDLERSKPKSRVNQAMISSSVGIVPSSQMDNPEIKSAPQSWELDVCPLISSRKWLQTHGLKRTGLDIYQLLSSIGFKLSDDYDFSLKRPVSSSYGRGYFNQVSRPDGKTFNLTMTKDGLHHVEARLVKAIMLYKRRLDWLTSESRRIFGVIEERTAVIVLDIRNMSPQQFDQYRSALERVLREQVSQLTKFNLIRAVEDVEMYNPDCLPVTHDTIEGAVQWLWGCDRLAPVSKTATCEAVVKALTDRNAESVYLFTEGSAVDGSRQILKQKLSAMEKNTPVHVISYNCTDSETIQYLRDLAEFTGGRFHAYAVIMEMDAYDSQPVNPKNSRANIVVKRSTYGGVPPGAGVREDVLLVFEELEEARNNLAQIQNIMEQIPDPKFILEETLTEIIHDKSKIPKPGPAAESSEQYMSSITWLKTYGLEAKKLGLYDLLSGVSFKHHDGVVDLMDKPRSDTQTDAVPRQKLVNARYCDRFPVVRWKDGHVVHVQVTPDIHRGYEERMNVALNKIKQRIDWLKQGSRELFGTVLEEQIYILVDTSSSMIPHLQFVKDKLFLLLQEQLRHKMKFNLVSFNSKAYAWRDRLMDVTECNLQGAWTWVQELGCQGSTNTYAAIQSALHDNQTQAIYLLSDGRPDQPPKCVIAQVQMQNRVPIHTISFNCNDGEANEFLYDLARVTGGRFHYFNETGAGKDIPDTYESEDVQVLRDEYDSGLCNLNRVAELREECASLACSQQVDKQLSARSSTPSTLPSLSARDFYKDKLSARPRSAPPQDPPHAPSPPPRPSTVIGVAHQPRRSLSPRLYSAKFSRKPPTAGHTRTSLLRTMSSGGRFNPDSWLLPETQELFDSQTERQRMSLDPESKREVVMRRRKKTVLKKQRIVDEKCGDLRQWLTKNSLMAKKLTILDALSPTMVPHRAKYVPILDKHVLAKVFNNVLPLAHVSGRDQKQINLINPNGVNLYDYEERVEQQLEIYRQKLDQEVWDALSDDTKKQFDSQDEPVPFVDNKVKLLRALEEEDWPLSQQDITLLETEIVRAEKFIQQSRDLRREAKDRHSKRLSRSRRKSKRKTNDDSDDSDEDFGYVKHSYINADKPDVTSQRDDKSDPGNDSNGDNKIDKDVKSDQDDKSDNDNRSDRQSDRDDRSVNDKDEGNEKDNDRRDDSDVYEDKASLVSRLTPKPEFEGLGDVLSAKQKRRKGKKKTGSILDCLRGQKVIARDEQDGCYYPGHVLECVSPRRAVVEFEDSSRQDVPTRFILPISGAVACPLLRVGDYVFVRVLNRDTDREVYIPGIVQMTPRRLEDSAKFFTLLTYNAQTVTTMRNHMLKITKARFEFTCRYIKDKLSGDTSGGDTRSPSRESSERSRSPRERPKTRRSRKHPNDTRKSKSRSPASSSSLSRERNRQQQEILADHKRTIDDLQRQLEEQQERQDEHQRKLRKQSKKLAHMKKKLHEKRQKQTTMEEKYDQQTDEPPADEGEFACEEDQYPDRGRRQVATPAILELRRRLPPIVNRGVEVLARWSDDGWYYRGTVSQASGSYQYYIEDCAGSVEKIWREDLITDGDTDRHQFKVADKVVALHPGFSFSYAPATISRVFEDLKMHVVFYDGVESDLPLDEVYSVIPEKYLSDRTYIIQQEKERKGQVVIARKDDTGEYLLGYVDDVLGDRKELVILWADKSTSVQKSNLVFGAFTKNYPVNVGDRVLAVADEVSLTYLPGIVQSTDSSHLVVKFCNGHVSNSVEDRPVRRYWLSQTFYDNAVSFYKSRNATI